MNSPSPRGGLLGSLVESTNRSRLFRRRVRLWGHTLRAPSADRLLALWLLRSGLMGGPEVAALRRLVPSGARVVDCGANQGAFTLLLSDLVGPTGVVVAIEPDPFLFEALRDACRSNAVANVELHRVAVSDRDGRALLHSNALNWGDGRLGMPPAVGRSVEVETRILDGLVGEQPIHLVKMDVQGHEPAVLAGFRSALSGPAPPLLLFEFHPHLLKAAGFEPEALLAGLEADGYRLFGLTSDGAEIDIERGALARLQGPLGYVNLVGRPTRSASPSPSA